MNTDQTPTKSALEEAIQALIDALKPTVNAYIEAGKWLMRTLQNAGITTDRLREQQAIKNGNRYWEDTKHRLRRTPGRNPLIHNGKKPR